MDILVPLFWVIVIIISIISALAKKQGGNSQDKSLAEGNDSRKPGEAFERFLRQLAGEEEMKGIPPPQPIVERVISSPVPQPAPPPPEKIAAPPRVEEPIFKGEPSERAERIIQPLLGAMDAYTVRQGIILAEVLGPPRGERPL